MSIREYYDDILAADGSVIGRRLVVVRDETEVKTTPYMSHFGFLSRLTPQERGAIR